MAPRSAGESCRANQTVFKSVYVLASNRGLTLAASHSCDLKLTGGARQKVFKSDAVEKSLRTSIITLDRVFYFPFRRTGKERSIISQTAAVATELLRCRIYRSSPPPPSCSIANKEARPADSSTSSDNKTNDEYTNRSKQCRTTVLPYNSPKTVESSIRII
jgi:hypothetical protein